VIWNILNRMKMNCFLYFSILSVTLILSQIISSGNGQLQNTVQTGPNYGHELKQPQVIAQNSVRGNSSIDETAREKFWKSNSYSNPGFIFFNSKSGIVNFWLSQFWKDQFNSCISKFSCTGNFSTGWKDNTSFQLSTTNITKNTWSWIYGQNMSVKPNDNYRFVTHMKLNNWALQSHVVLEGFNETTKVWYKINQCPSGTKGPLEWQQFSCLIAIPQNTTKIRPVLNAGWSSQVGKEATTWFDSLYLIKNDGPLIGDSNLKAELYYQGLENPTSVAFLDPNDMLVSENHNGKIERIVNGVKVSKPLLDLAVAKSSGLLGIAIQNNLTGRGTSSNNESTYVFLYFTAAQRDGGKGIGNRLYRYELVDNRLVNPKLLLDLPAGRMHNGGQILIGPDKYVYVIIGELMDRTGLSNEKSKALNNESKAADDPDGRGGVLRIDQNGQPVGAHGILGDYSPLNKYYAYGIRNSFGMDFDPLTGNLWDTENGPIFGDEINLVKPGFDSGWRKVQGIWTVADGVKGAENKGDLASENPDNLVDFNGKGKYSSPEFTWKKTVGPTALKFLTTDKLGKQYENDMFVADADNGRIYHFKLNQHRTGLLLKGPLADKVADSDNELDNVVFAGFGGTVTDLEIGPDGYLYVLSHDQGRIYRIVPNHLKQDILY
jgi:aldose sugar dehydrogenase